MRHGTSTSIEVIQRSLNKEPVVARLVGPRTILYLLIASVTIVFCLWAIFAVSNAPTPGFKLQFLCTVWNVQPGSHAEKAGLRAGDQIQEINGTPILTTYDARPVTAQLHVGDNVSLKVRRNNDVFTTRLAMTSHPFPVWPLVALAGYMALLVGGFSLYLQRSHDPAFRVYLLLVPAAMLWSITRLLIDDFLFINPLFHTCFLAGFFVSFFFFPLSAHFGYVFTGQRLLLSLTKRALMMLIYGPIAAFVALHIALFLLYFYLQRAGSIEAAFSIAREFAPFSYVLTLSAMIFNGFLILLTLFLFTRAYLLSDSAELRSQIKLILLGIISLFFLAAFALVFSQIIVLGKTQSLKFVVNAIMEFCLSMGLMFLLLMTALAMIRFQLSKVDYLINQTMIYGLLSGVLFFIYLVLFYIASLSLGQTTAKGNPLVFFTAALILVILFEPMKNRFQNFVDRTFYKDRRDFQNTFNKAVSILSSILDLDSLLEKMIGLVVEDTNVERGLLLMSQDGGQSYEIAAHKGFIGPEPGESILEPDGPTARVLKKIKKPISRFSFVSGPEDISEEDHAHLMPLFDAMNLEAFAPLVYEEECLGILGLGRKRSRRMYTPNEMEILSNLSKQCAVFIRNAQLHVEVETLNTQQKALNESLERQIEIIEEQKQEIQELHKSLKYENISLKEKIAHSNLPVELIGEYSSFQNLLKEAKNVAATKAVVLISGETGTGKDLIARMIHQTSHRKRAAFICVNCSTIPEGLLESELFGHEKGAFTGAVGQRIGKFELAHWGTLFLNEVGEMSLPMQAKLLRAIEHGEFERVGGTKTIHVDVRIIAATNRKLDEAIRDGAFREDLYYRLNVVPIRVPPLRERREDIPLLARYFLRKYARKMKKDIHDLDEKTLQGLMQYPWPGNVRELENVIERAVVLCQSERLSLPPLTADTVDESSEGLQSMNLQASIKEFKRKQVLKALEHTKWNKVKAANMLGIQYPNIFRLMRELGIKEGTHWS